MKSVVLLLSLLSLGHSAPLSSCDILLKPITISTQEMCKLPILHAAGTSASHAIRDGRSFKSGGYSMFHDTGEMAVCWGELPSPRKPFPEPLNDQCVAESYFNSQKFGECSSLSYDVIFENSTLIEEPFFLKEVYLPTGCSDCLLAYEEIISGKDTFITLLLMSRERSVSPDVVETLKKQAECLQLPPPIMIDPNYEICPDNIPPCEGLSAMNKLLQAKTGHRLARVLDTLFDLFVN